MPGYAPASKVHSDLFDHPRKTNKNYAILNTFRSVYSNDLDEK